MAKYEFTSKGPKIIWVPFWILVSSRPRQWLKNLALFAPLVFEGAFFREDQFSLVVFGFIIFCAITSSTYLINDVVDRVKDKSHPFKSNRPIAAGKIHPILALLVAILIIFVSLILASKISLFFTYATKQFLAFDRLLLLTN